MIPISLPAEFLHYTARCPDQLTPMIRLRENCVYDRANHDENIASKIFAYSPNFTILSESVEELCWVDIVV